MIQQIKNSKYLLVIAIAIVFLLNVTQAFTTDLLADEAYYWVYSLYLDWGYFDHPPMVALWIKLSSFLFDGELGVRFFSSIMLAFIMYLIWKLIDHPKKKEFTWLYILLFVSTCLLNVYGFITTPDTPLTFFFVVFLLGYQKYLKERNLASYLLLSISMAGMMYSKYQGILIVGFVILSNFKLFKDYKLWLTALGAFILFIPHLYWQFDNDFASLKYHLFERGVDRRYKFRYTYMHIVNAIAIIGFTFPILYKALFKGLKTKDLFHRALNFIVLGFLIFFFFMSFKTHVQAQWIVSISIPLIYITFNYLVENKQHRPLFIKLAVFTFIVTIYIRFYLVHHQLFPLQLEMHNNKEWVAKLHEQLDGKTPVFQDSYQNTSTYWFYSNNKPCQYNSYYSRKNQYELIDFVGKCKAENVAHVGLDSDYNEFIARKRNHLLHVSYLDSYISIRDISHEFLGENIQLKKGLNKYQIEILNPLKQVDTKDYSLGLALFNTDKKIIKEIQPVNVNINPNNLNEATLEFWFDDDLEYEIGYFQIVAKPHYKMEYQRSGSITPIQQIH